MSLSDQQAREIRAQERAACIALIQALPTSDRLPGCLGKVPVSGREMKGRALRVLRERGERE